ncbi:uncharacterized protein Z520_09596 [Fonsecaea multimorphosa CBS 102226]|uniref:Uncharacterized protein n=1 Tax=Fonsecaea multimorphosa CBS 102226 TaxID=1442371 RepID=A0A0D2GYB2_9EURO|nr:uncharacterized protein Z520_09596 [Fonsecaea multimorphosa CBS 102226]KIX94550.1 hypothetical protein Z520_09596 [Fonsecaea multimorphosa CBS 102226]
MTRNATNHPTRASPGDQGHPPPKQRSKMEEYDRIQRRQRAELILSQYDLLMKYALENKLTREYFRKVALGIPTDPVIKNWFPI